jgi:hypothetical protein
MDSFLGREEAYLVLGLSVLALPLMVTVIAYFWSEVRREEIRAGLKHAMLERGMSASEIRTVLEAGSGKATSSVKDPAHLQGAEPVS